VYYKLDNVQIAKEDIENIENIENVDIYRKIGDVIYENTLIVR
jgi:chaperonin cofactor prefoldin